MTWLLIRVAIAVAICVLCYGSLSSEDLYANKKSGKPESRSNEVSSPVAGVSGPKQDENGTFASLDVFLNSSESCSILTDKEIAVARTGAFSAPDNSNDFVASSRTPSDERITFNNFIHVRGGQHDELNATSNVSSTVSIVEADGRSDVNSVDYEVDDDTMKLQDTDPSFPSISSSLKSKVTDRIKRWKRSDRTRTIFLDRMALVSDALLSSEHDAMLEKEEDDIQDEVITHQSDLTREGRYFTIVTTAALPWMTGTAVNPLLRAAHLVKKTQQINNSTQQQWVTLVVPWLELEEDRQELYGRVFSDEEEQEDYIRTWLREDADMADAADPRTGLKIRFYPARYHPGLKSIFAMGDMCSLIPDDEADVCILEEPEHLNWYRAPGEGWTKKFHYVIGIVHTNYKEYASAHYSGLWTAPAIAVMSSAMVRAYCHKVIKLSDVLQTFAPEKEETSNVHGVRAEFLKEGLRRAQEESRVPEIDAPQEPEETTVYFIGKLLWAKGLDILLDLEEYYKQCTGEYFSIDVYGSGPELTPIVRSYHGRKQLKENCEDEDGSVFVLQGDNDVVEEVADVDEESTRGKVLKVQTKTRQRLQKIKKSIQATTESLEFDLPKSLHEYRRQPIPATFHGRVDHALLTKQYKVFVNPSITEVLCTTTAEALAMGKFAIIPKHPSNTFFLRFPNCLAYRNQFEFVANLRWALTHEPEPLTSELAREFTWEAATDRLIQASAITHREAVERERLGLTKLDERIAWFHNELGKGVTGDAIRKVLGGGPVSHQVKYQLSQQTVDEPADIEQGDENASSDEESEDEDEGLPQKLRMSSFANAVRSTVVNGLPSLKAGTG